MNTLDTFLGGKYQLKQEAPAEELTGVDIVEYANQSLFFLGNETTNLWKHLKEKKDEYLDLLSDELKDNTPGNDIPFTSNALEYSNAIKNAFTQITKKMTKLQYHQNLEHHLQTGSSAMLFYANQLQSFKADTWTMDHPSDDWNSEPLQPQIIKLSFQPFRKDVLTDLIGILFGEDLNYESPRHKEVLQQIVSGKLTEYRGHALCEHREAEHKNKQAAQPAL